MPLGWTMSVPKTRSVLGVLAMGIVIALAGSGPASAAESDLRSGLAHLRAGAQGQAEHDLTKYRDGERDSDIRRSIDRVLPLLRRPLADDVREYIAGAIEESVRMNADARRRRVRSSYASRMFPVFP